MTFPACLLLGGLLAWLLVELVLWVFRVEPPDDCWDPAAWRERQRRLRGER